jgi:hypothetical protein
MKTPALLVLSLVLLAAPARAQDFYKFTWDTRAEGRSTATFNLPSESGYRDGYGLASIRPRGDGGLIVRFEGVGGSGLASVEVETAHVSPRCVAAMVTVPIRLGPEDASVDHVPGCYSWIGEFAAPESFVLTAFSASQGGIVDFASSGARLLARPSFANPAAGATLSGVVQVEMKWQGPLPGTPVGVHLLVDGVPRFTHAGTGGSVTHAWDTRAVADGARRLEVWLTDGEGARIWQGAMITVTVANTATTGGERKVSHEPVRQRHALRHRRGERVDRGRGAGSDTLGATVRDGTGNAGRARIPVIVRN